MSIRLAFIGAAGVPNNYGGFEMFLEVCSPRLTQDFASVTVTCDASRYSAREKFWNGVRRVFIPVRANGPQSIIHDFLAFMAVWLRADAIVVLGVSGGIFFPIFRLLCDLLRKKLIVNVDGIEWRRTKFSKAQRTFLFISDRLAQRFAHSVIVDNEALRKFLIPSKREKACSIAYPGDHVRRVANEKIQTGLKLLTICRIEPENNCHMLLDAFARLNDGEYIFVGNWDASSYGRSLRSKFKDVPGLTMSDPIYEPQKLASLRENCTHYLHGHSVGGTNPSLVEMLFYDCHILAFDCEFNRITGRNSIHFFSDEHELCRNISAGYSTSTEQRAMVRTYYTLNRICGEYKTLVEALLQRPGLANNDELVVMEEDEANPVET